MNAPDDRAIELEELMAAEELDPSDHAILNSLRAYYDEVHPGSSRPWEVMNNSE